MKNKKSKNPLFAFPFHAAQLKKYILVLQSYTCQKDKMKGNTMYIAYYIIISCFFIVNNIIISCFFIVYNIIISCFFRLVMHFYQRGDLMDKTLRLSTKRSGVRNPGQGKCSLKTTAVDERVKYSLFFYS